MKKELRTICKGLLWFLEGVIVGFGAIMPGISGGTLCVAFGMYLPLISLFSNPKENVKKYWKMLLTFVLGTAFGFICLSGIASYLLEKNSTLMVCLFVGLIIGTFPQLWKEAGSEGRSKKSFVSLILAFIVMLSIMTIIQMHSHLKIKENILGFLFCGIVWGLSFIVPGLSSSTLLLFFGLYEPMLDGIANFNFQILLPLGIGMLLCILLLSKCINKAYQRHYSILSHGVLGIVVATVVMIFPSSPSSFQTFSLQILYILFGCILSFALTKICDKISRK